MTNQEKPSQSWSEEIRYLDQELLTRHFQGIESPLYYVVGPSVMVESVRNMLSDAGVHKTDIRTEEGGM